MEMIIIAIASDFPLTSVEAGKDYALAGSWASSNHGDVAPLPEGRAGAVSQEETR